MEGNNLIRNKRKYYIDILRILSSFAVVVIHVSAGFIIDENMEWFSFDWYFHISSDVLCHFAVPIFFMISGCLFLDSSYKLDIKKLYSKKILRLVTALVFWMLVYSVFKFVFGDYDNILTVLLDEGSYLHLWYIPVCIIIYILVPVIKKLVEDEKILKYFMIFIIVTQSIFTTAMIIRSDFTEYLSLIYNRFKLGSDIVIYIGYFILGYYLSKKALSKKARTILYVSAIISTLLTVALTIYSATVDKNIDAFMNYKCFTILIEATAVFVLFKEIFERKNFSDKACKVIKYLSSWSFGVYLVHLLVMKLLEHTSLFSTNFYAGIIMSVATFIISIIISAVLNKIPIVNKYIV